MDDFLNHNDIIVGFPTRDKACLEWVDEVTKEGLQAEYKNFGNSLVESVAKANRVKLVDRF